MSKPISPNTRVKVMHNWRLLLELNEQAEATILDLMSHPDATPEQIMEVRERLVQTRKQITDVWESIKKHFDHGSYFTARPPRFIEMRRAAAERRRKELRDKVSLGSIINR